MPFKRYDVVPTAPVLHKTHCCGIMEIDYLGKAKAPIEALKAIAPSMWLGASVDPYDNGRHAPRFITFSGVTNKVFGGAHDGPRKDNYGQALADYIVNNNLGVVTASPEAENWTRNTIKLWVWTPDYKAVWPYFDANGITYKPEPRVEEEVEIEVEDDEDGA